MVESGDDFTCDSEQLDIKHDYAMPKIGGCETVRTAITVEKSNGPHYANSGIC